ncbi:sensor histidine kinase [Brucellaceae bacterium C25G]
MTKNKQSRLIWVAGILAIWLLCIASYAALSINSSLKRSSNELNETGFLIHRMISQRAAQHDAHMTTLASLALVDEKKHPELLTQVSDSIMQFYPRIEAIREIEIAWHDPAAKVDIKQLWSTPTSEIPFDDVALGQKIFIQKAGEGKSHKNASPEQGYLLTKKLNEHNPALALIMRINPKKLIDLDELPEWASLELSLDDTILMDRDAEQKASSWLKTPSFERMIDSQSQPLRLVMERPVSLNDLLDGITFVFVAIASLTVLLLLGYSLQHRHEVKRLKASADMAEQRSLTLARETRLAHVERVNSMGELASGIAHELAQPLTALMSQSRAAERLFDQAGIDNALLKKAMSANVREARRAGDMLKRMRDYISNRPPKPVTVSINQIINDTAELLRTDLAQRNITLELILAADPPVFHADPIELEQVFNNLIRNAADSLQAANIPEARIKVATKQINNTIEITIKDNGTGFSPDVLPRLFEPFFTTKKDGMGLGLALCARLVERIGGHIVASNNENSGACFTVTLPILPEGAAK